MATKLLKPVKRELLRDRYIIELVPGDVIRFREKRKKTTYEISIGHCINLAILNTIELEYREKLKSYQEKKKLGYKRLKKPRKPSSFFSSTYTKVLARK